MDTESFASLDYDLFLEKLGNESSSELVKNYILKIKPETSREMIIFNLSLTGEWLKIIEKENISFSEIIDIENILSRAFNEGEGMSVSEIYSIGKLLSISSDEKNKIKKINDNLPITIEILNNVDFLTSLQKKIKTSIDKNGDIKDSASLKLSKIRKRIFSQIKVLKKNFESVSNKNKKYLQENFTTQRNNRFVLAVKSEKQNMIKGLIHDVSESGGTVFLEPITLVKDNNTLLKLYKDEFWEIKKIIKELTNEIFINKNEIINNFEMLVKLDIALAKARLSKKLKGIYPNEGKLNFENVRHPLLLLLNGEENTVPLDLSFPHGKNAIVISGPNAGGKTIALKSAGLLILLSYIGIFIPAGQNTTIPYDLKIISEGGDYQSIESNVSTFSARVKRWVKILKRVDDKTLVLFDEIGSSTDPERGSSLAIALINAIVSKGAFVIATTNILYLKILVEKFSNIINASMDINMTNYEPIYKLTMGIPGSSYTLKIARKYGIPEGIINNAKELLTSHGSSYEEIINKVKRSLDEISYKKESLSEEKKIIEKEMLDLKLSNEKFLKEKDEFIALFENERKELFSEARKKIEFTIKEIQEEKAKKETIIRAKEFFKETQHKKEKTSHDNIKTGDIVYVKSLNDYGEIIRRKGNSYHIKVGSLKIVSKLGNIIKDFKKIKKNIDQDIIFTRDREISSKIDLRGLDIETAIEKIEVFLDDAIIAEIPFLTIIHGIGMGKLKIALEDYLKKKKYRFRSGLSGEGGAGVTIVSI